MKTATISTTFDFSDGGGPVPAHQHLNGGGWVAETAHVDDSAYVGENATVFGRARVCNYAQVYGDAQVYDRAWVYDRARIFGMAWVYGRARVDGDAQVYDRARVHGRAWVYGNSVLCGNAETHGNAPARGNAKMCGDSRIGSDRPRHHSNTAQAFRSDTMKIDITATPGKRYRVKCIACRGGLAITKRLANGREARGWLITHVQSSARLGVDINPKNQREAMIVFDSLLSSGVDWTLHESVLLECRRRHAAEKAIASAVEVLDLHRANRR